MEDSMNDHSMITRSKKKYQLELDKENKDIIEEIDENGNLSDFIDNNCDTDFDNDMFQKELIRLRGNRSRSSSISNSPSKKKKRKKKNENIVDIFLPYILMNIMAKNKIAIDSQLGSKTKKVKKRKSKTNIDFVLNNLKEKENNIDTEISEEENEQSEEDNEGSEEEIIFNEDNCEDSYDQNVGGSDSESDFDGDLEDEEDLEVEGLEDEDLEDEDLEDESDEDESDEDELYDDFDEKFADLIDTEINDEEEFDYFHNLSETEKIKHINDLEKIKEINRSNIPMRFKILNSEMDIKTKSIAIDNIEKLNEMDVSTGEYCKMDKWISGLIRIPFGNISNIPVNNDTPIKETQEYLVNTQKILDKAIFGHKEAKMHILQVIGKWIRNPNSQGNVLALEGPMGNGKTTLVKEGIAKAINRPFAFIALGGASDSSFFDGHSYTYEGSHWGRIIDILIESKCMNPIIYFDELDKVSDTHKGEEITHLLTHLTDPSQNSLFQDNYFPGINIDLSKALFIFSFNDEEKVDRILKDRMYVINTKGFKPEDKLSICKEYILPELLSIFRFTTNDIIFPDDSLLYIIENHTSKEEGVRNLKRCLETIISKINIYNLSNNKTTDDHEKIPLTFDIKDFSIPMNITEEIVKILVTTQEDIYKPPEHMYM